MSSPPHHPLIFIVGELVLPWTLFLNGRLQGKKGESGIGWPKGKLIFERCLVLVITPFISLKIIGLVLQVWVWGSREKWVGGAVEWEDRMFLTGSGQKNEVEAGKVWGHRIVGTSVYRLLVLVAQLANKGTQPHKTVAFCTFSHSAQQINLHFKYKCAIAWDLIF